MIVKPNSPTVAKGVGTITPYSPSAVGETVIADIFRGTALNAMNAQTGFMNLDLSASGSEVNNVIQFDIANTGQGHAQCVLRVGGLAGIEGNYSNFNLLSDASNLTAISDQYGAKVLAIQGFNKMVCARPVLVTEFRIRSSDATQIITAPKFRTLNWDGTITEKKVNLTKYESMDDQRTNLTIARPPSGSIGWILDCQKFIEFTILDNVSLSILLTVAGADNVGQMTPIG